DDSDNLFVIGPAGNEYYINIPGDGNLLDNEYTSAPGDNTNSGTDPAAPMASLRALLAAYDLDPGDVVWVDPGWYNLVASVEIGSADQGITIRGPEGLGHVATLDRNNYAFGAVILSGANAVTIRHLALTGGQYGLHVKDGSSYLTADAVTAYDNRDAGIYVADVASDHVSISNGEFYGTTGNENTDQERGLDLRGLHPAVTDSVLYHTPGSHGEGAYVYNVSTATLTGNEAYNNATGIYVYADQFTVSGNFVHQNTTGLSLYDFSSAVYSPVFDNEAASNTNGIWSNGYEEIYENDVHDNADVGIGTAYNYSRTIRDNEIHHNVRGVYLQNGLVTHNRIYFNTDYGIDIYYNAGTIENNAIYGNSTGIYDR
ncbi:hypothetical protein LCGC14_2968420, partial [marine sediment metagenome]